MDINQEPAALKDILDAEMDRHDWRRAKWVYRLQSHWSLVVGEILAKHTRLISVDTKVIVIAVQSSSWTQELTYWKPEIHRRLNEMTQGETKHAEIRIQVWSKALNPNLKPLDDRYERGLPYQKPSVTSDDLEQLVDRVRDKYTSAVEYWIASGYDLCERCQSPTLKGYRWCACCERLHASQSKDAKIFSGKSTSKEYAD